MLRALLFLLLLLKFPACSTESHEVVALSIEHAISIDQHKKGLAGREMLEENHGMLFHFGRPKYAQFWMYQTRFDLAIAFLDKNGVIMEIAEMKAFPEESNPSFFYQRMVTSSAPASYALEMAGGWFSRKQVKPGDRLHWSFEKESAYITRQK